MNDHKIISAINTPSFVWDDLSDEQKKSLIQSINTLLTDDIPVKANYTDILMEAIRRAAVRAGMLQKDGEIPIQNCLMLCNDFFYKSDCEKNISEGDAGPYTYQYSAKWTEKPGIETLIDGIATMQKPIKTMNDYKRLKILIDKDNAYKMTIVSLEYLKY